jgi:hypothetical protein
MLAIVLQGPEMQQQQQQQLANSDSPMRMMSGIKAGRFAVQVAPFGCGLCGTVTVTA